MESILLKIAEHLNKRGVHWGIGGSLLLVRHVLVDTARDIDLIVAESDITAAMDEMAQIGARDVALENPAFISRHFAHYVVEGIDVDMIAGFTIHHATGDYVFPFDDRTITEKASIDGIEIPYTSLEDWLVAYMLMEKREWKADIIWAHLHRYGVNQPELLQRALLQPLPEAVVERIHALLHPSSESVE